MVFIFLTVYLQVILYCLYSIFRIVYFISSLPLLCFCYHIFYFNIYIINPSQPNSFLPREKLGSGGFHSLALCRGWGRGYGDCLLLLQSTVFVPTGPQAPRLCQVPGALQRHRRDRSQYFRQSPQKLECWGHSPSLSLSQKKLDTRGFSLIVWCCVRSTDYG